MNAPTAIQLLGAALFAIALVHTFSTRFFERLAHARPAHAGIFHLLGEVEVSFGLWAMALVVAMMAIAGPREAIAYLDQRDFTEPMFVFAVMVIEVGPQAFEAANGAYCGGCARRGVG